jgi:hypothetical protein
MYAEIWKQKLPTTKQWKAKLGDSATSASKQKSSLIIRYCTLYVPHITTAFYVSAAFHAAQCKYYNVASFTAVVR